jgi:poly(A) polymerase
MVEDDMYNNALEIIRILKDAGHKAFLVGGCVRDMILGYKPKDYDIVTSAKPSQIVNLFIRTVKVGIQFGVVIVLMNGYEFDVATFRKDLDYKDGRHPEGVEFSNEKEDVLRRDVTINGLLYDPVIDKYIDYVNGIDDIKNKIIRTIGDPIKRFSEDYLRLIRAIRFSARYSFNIEEDTYNAIIELAPNIKKISKERIKDELDKLLSHKNRSLGVKYLYKSGLFKHILPEINHKYDDNMISYLINTLDMLPEKVNYEIPIAIIFIISYFEDVYNRNPKKDELEKISDICKNMKMSNKETHNITEMYRVSFLLWICQEYEDWRIKRLLRSDQIRNAFMINHILCDTMKIDSTSIEYCEDYLEKHKDELYIEPLINGKDLIKMGFKSGKIFSEILFDIENKQLEKKIITKDEAIEYIKNNFFS